MVKLLSYTRCNYNDNFCSRPVQILFLFSSAKAEKSSFFFFSRSLKGKQIKQIPTKYSHAESTKFLVLTVVSILCIVAVLLASTVVYCLRHRSHHKIKEKLTNLGTETSGDATATYQVGGLFY